MPSVTGSKTVTKTPAPHITATTLTTLLATPIEDLKVSELRIIEDALSRSSAASNPSATVGSCLS